MAFLLITFFLRYVELLISSQNLVDYVDLLLKKERQSLNDSIIRNFMEFFYPKVSLLVLCSIDHIINSSSSTVFMTRESVLNPDPELHSLLINAGFEVNPGLPIFD